MSTATPLVFRPSLAQRSLVGLLFAGSWIVGIRVIVLLIQNFPRMYANLKLAQATGDSTAWLWVGFGAAIAACLLSGLLLSLSLMTMLLVEGTHVLTDEMGISVEYLAVPRRFARWIGAGRLSWKEIHSLEKHRLFFVLRGDAAGEEDSSPKLPIAQVSTLRFLLVDELERLVLLILERSTNLRFEE
jgi:hypothetical protein